MTRAVGIDVLHRVCHRGNHPDCKNHVEVLCIPIIFSCRLHARHERLRGRVTTQLDTQFGEPFGQSRQELCCHLFVHKQRFHRIADTGPLALRVFGNGHGHVEIRRRIHVRMTYTLVMLDHGYSRLLRDGADEGLPATRNDQVNAALPLDQLEDTRAIRAAHELD